MNFQLLHSLNHTFLLKFYGIKLSHLLYQTFPPPVQVSRYHRLQSFSITQQRETRFISRLVICKVESFMLHPICGFVASLKDLLCRLLVKNFWHNLASKRPQNSGSILGVALKEIPTFGSLLLSIVLSAPKSRYEP